MITIVLPELEMNPNWKDTLVTVDGLGPWSYSKKKSLEQCPLKFFLQYVLKLKVPPIEDGSLPSNHIGSALHQILEDVTIGKSVEGSYIRAKQKYFDLVTPEHWETYVVGNEYNVIDFRRKLDEFEAKHKVKRYLCEIRLAVTKEWEPTDFFAQNCYYRGVVDLVIQLENQDAIIIDHKSNLNSNGFCSTKYFKEQLEVYKPLIHHGLAPLRGAQSGVHFISDGKVVLDEYHDADTISSRLRNRMEFSVENAVQAVVETGYFKKSTGSFCKWCDYREMCKGKEKLLKPYEEMSKELLIPAVSVE